MGSQVGDYMSGSITFMLLPENQWLDENGYKVTNPVYRLTVVRNGQGVSVDGPNKMFKNLIDLMELGTLTDGVGVTITVSNGGVLNDPAQTT